MIDGVKDYIRKYPQDIQKMFVEIRALILENAHCEVEEKLWARMPSYFNGKKFVRIIVFKDHININASAVTKFSGELDDFKITPKGMLQLYNNQQIPIAVLQKIIIESLSN